MMSDNVEDLTELRLWSLEKIKENKAKVARAHNKKVKTKKNSRLETWFGRQCYHWELKTGSMVSGFLLVMGRTRLIRSCLQMRTCLKN